jgi:tetratricopeptide (TPR) repeat protein
VAALLVLPGCDGGLVAVLSIGMGAALGAWMMGRDRQQRALFEAATLRHAIATGQHREIEVRLRRLLALAEAGEAIGAERQWLARAQLSGLLVAEWRLDEARDVYGAEQAGLSRQLQALANFGRHELAVLTEDPDASRLEQIQADRDACLAGVPPRFQAIVADAWHALEGLCLVRMGRAREGAALLERGLPSLEYNPARVVYLFHLAQAYEHLGERRLAGERYREAMEAFPGTRLASEAATRSTALGASTTDGLFRGMLPEAPAASPSTALVRRRPDGEG